MKLFRIPKRRKNGGFTLVEVIISCVLLGILILGVFSVVTPIISGVKSREQSANALMLAEAAQEYINRSIKNSVMVAIFENAKPDDMKENQAIPKSPQMDKMLAFIKGSDNKDALGNEVYELKCIGIRWKYDAKSQQYKYMLTNELVNKEKGTVDIDPLTTKSFDVFETCFYENLYPTFAFDIMETQVLDDDGNPVMEGGNPKMEEIPAIKMIINVFRDADMENMAVQNTDYTDFTNIRRGAMPNSKLYSKKDTTDSEGNVTEKGTVIRGADEFADDEHAETYIYYITRKLKATTPTTPSSSSTT